jgi:hypothetical protein
MSIGYQRTSLSREVLYNSTVFIVLSALTAALNLLFSIFAAHNLSSEEFSRFLAIWGLVSAISFVGGILQISIASSTRSGETAKQVESKQKLKSQRLVGSQRLFVYLFLVISTLVLLFVGFLHLQVYLYRTFVFLLLTSLLQIYLSVLLGFLQLKFSPLRWGMLNFGLASVKTLVVFFASLISQNALWTAISLLTFNYLVIFLTFRVSHQRIDKSQIIAIAKSELGRILTFSVFWIYFYLDIVFVRFYYGNEDSASYALTSNLVKVWFAINLLDLWGESRKIKSNKMHEEGFTLTRLFRREIVKTLLIVCVASLVGGSLFQKLFGLKYEFLLSEMIILLLAGVFLSLAYSTMILSKLSRKGNLVLSIYLISSTLTFYILNSNQYVTLELLYLIFSVAFFLITRGTTVERIIPAAIQNLYKRNKR